MRVMIKLMKAILGAVGCILSILVLWVMIHTGITMYEKNHYKAPGQMVEVDGKNMHVYVTGKGYHTIVLMSGLGTAAPALDFEPLMEQLKTNHEVVVVEGFGYGYSDQTSKERSVENIVEELRSALAEAGVDGPYVLMPHSISGIYAIYYANHYPKEVSAIIGLDCTLPRMCDYFEEETPSAPTYMSYLAPLGIARLATIINPSEYLPVSDTGTYSNETLAEIKAITARNGYNKDIVMETNAIADNMEQTYDLEFDQNLPVLMFTRNTKASEDGKNKETFYNTYLSGVKDHKVVVLDGPHYLHWKLSKEIGKAVTEWLSTR